MRYYIIVADARINDKSSYWSRGYNGFVENELSCATQFHSLLDVCTELVDEELTDIAHVRAVQPIGS